MSPNEPLPTDLEACHALIVQQVETGQRLARDDERLKFEIEQLKRYIYGRRSERHVQEDSQLTLFDEPAAEERTDATTELIEEEITSRRRKRSKSDRFPENLARQIQTIDVPEEERLCPCCGEEMPVIGTDARGRPDQSPDRPHEDVAAAKQCHWNG